MLGDSAVVLEAMQTSTGESDAHDILAVQAYQTSSIDSQILEHDTDIADSISLITEGYRMRKKIRPSIDADTISPAEFKSTSLHYVTSATSHVHDHCGILQSTNTQLTKKVATRLI